MDENKAYYTLRYERNDGLHKAGERLTQSADVVRIGQEEDCEVRFGNDTDLADETFAVIRPCKKIGGWQLVACSPHMKPCVNGTEVSLVHYLEDGDHLTFEDRDRGRGKALRQELLFHVHRDGKYEVGSGTKKEAAPFPRKLAVALVAVFVLTLCAFGGYLHEMSRADEQRQALLDSVKPSVVQLSVDTVYYVERTPAGSRVLATYSYVASEGHNISGTAFLTQDSLLVTARHCIEPWLNDASAMTANGPKDLKSTPARWAMEAETYNQTHRGDTTYAVVGVCGLWGGENATEYLASHLSSDFRCDRTRDNVIELGDFYHTYYWRSIQRGHNRIDMMLGDIATLKVPQAGRIALAGRADMERMLKRNSRLDFIGYPNHEEKGLECHEGEVRLPFRQGDERLIAHSGQLAHGYSGGPVLVVERTSMLGGGKVYAVGVVSVADKVGDRSYSVPVTEIKREEATNEK